MTVTPASFQDWVLLVYTCATVLQVFIVAVTVPLVYRQAKAARLGVDNLDRTLRLSTLLSHHHQVIEVNKLLATNPDLGAALGYNSREYVYFMLIKFAEMVVYQRKAGSVDDETWTGLHPTFVKCFKMPELADLWRRTEAEYMPLFREYVRSIMPAGPA